MLKAEVSLKKSTAAAFLPPSGGIELVSNFLSFFFLQPHCISLTCDEDGIKLVITCTIMF